MKNYIFTSESVSEGHPDKICDRISDALVDECLKQNPYARTAIETIATTDYVGVIGEIGGVNLAQDRVDTIVRRVVKDIGYDQLGFSYKTINIDNRLHEQSADIAMGVDASDDKEEGAGDQGIMFGFACNESDVLMPAAIYYSHLILRRLAEDRHKGILSMLGPDAKSQVTLEYVDGIPIRARSVVLSTQHVEGLSKEDVRNIVKPYIAECLPEGWMCADDELYVNPTGRFVIGGPVGDSGLTGRKIIVDTYGGFAPHGGGAFSGKDPTKVDRSAAYAARYLAKNIVAAGYAQRCTIQLSYAIGVAKPISIYVNTHDTGTVEEEKIVESLQDLMDLSPAGIRKHLKLNRPIYERTAAYGHFGRQATDDGGFSWEKVDLVNDMKRIIG